MESKNRWVISFIILSAVGALVLTLASMLERMSRIKTYWIICKFKLLCERALNFGLLLLEAWFLRRRRRRIRKLFHIKPRTVRSVLFLGSRPFHTHTFNTLNRVASEQRAKMNAWTRRRPT
jgi:hypothetical protein